MHLDSHWSLKDDGEHLMVTKLFRRNSNYPKIAFLKSSGFNDNGTSSHLSSLPVNISQIHGFIRLIKHPWYGGEIDFSQRMRAWVQYKLYPMCLLYAWFLSSGEKTENLLM